MLKWLTLAPSFYCIAIKRWTAVDVNEYLKEGGALVRCVTENVRLMLNPQSYGVNFMKTLMELHASTATMYQAYVRIFRCAFHRKSLGFVKISFSLKPHWLR